jgi:DMSO reductase family type II enzyme heme b subunit
MIKKITGVLIVFLSFSFTAYAEREKFVEITSHLSTIDVAQTGLDDDVWKEIKAYKQPLQEQFLEIPKPKVIGVNEVFVQSINDGKYIAFRLIWKDDTKNDTPSITAFSDGAAIQFPVQGTIFPEYFM